MWPVSGERWPVFVVFKSLLLSCLSQVLGVLGLVDLRFSKRYINFVFSLWWYSFKNWRIVDLQCCVNFCCMAKWFSYTYICIYIHTHTHTHTRWYSLNIVLASNKFEKTALYISKFFPSPCLFYRGPWFCVLYPRPSYEVNQRCWLEGRIRGGIERLT